MRPAQPNGHDAFRQRDAGLVAARKAAPPRGGRRRRRSCARTGGAIAARRGEAVLEGGRLRGTNGADDRSGRRPRREGGPLDAAAPATGCCSPVVWRHLRQGDWRSERHHRGEVRIGLGERDPVRHQHHRLRRPPLQRAPAVALKVTPPGCRPGLSPHKRHEDGLRVGVDRSAPVAARSWVG